MKCDYFTYQKLTDELFYGQPLTEVHLNNAFEKLWHYLTEGGAKEVLSMLGIGLKVEERQLIFSELNEVVKRRFVYISGEYKGRELDISEVKAIGIFLKHGAYYGKTIS